MSSSIPKSDAKPSNSGNVRAAVLGVNDGLVSNFCLIMGVAGGTSGGDNPDLIVLAGIAALIAGSLSMATGEYISVRSQREIYEYQISTVRSELETCPEKEEKELTLIYKAKGLEEELAQKVVSSIMSNPDTTLPTRAMEKLGLNPENLGAPWKASISSLLAFALGAAVPVIPVVFSTGSTSIVISAIFSSIALFIVGGLVSIASGKNLIFGAARMLLAGGLAATFTYGVGYLLGISIL